MLITKSILLICFRNSWPQYKRFGKPIRQDRDDQYRRSLSSIAFRRQMNNRTAAREIVIAVSQHYKNRRYQPTSDNETSAQDPEANTSMHRMKRKNDEVSPGGQNKTLKKQTKENQSSIHEFTPLLIQ